MNEASSTRQVRLLGQPTLGRYLEFVQDSVVGGESLDGTELVDEWRVANDCYGELERDEAGLADDIEVFDLDSSLRPLVEEVMEDSRYRVTFDRLPTRFAMVELDHLVLYQTHVDLDFSEALQGRLGPSPDAERLFRFCMPPESPAESVQIRRMGENRFVFASESTDFRAHEPTLLEPEQISGFDTFGPLSGMVGLGVGFGSNFLTAIRAEGRVLLHNGYHRAHAMRALGITHAPCILQSVSRLDELEIVAKSVVLKDPDFYFGTARPPLLKDFFDSRMRREYSVHRTRKVIEVTFDIQDYRVRM